MGVFSNCLAPILILKTRLKMKPFAVVFIFILISEFVIVVFTSFLHFVLIVFHVDFFECNKTAFNLILFLYFLFSFDFTFLPKHF